MRRIIPFVLLGVLTSVPVRTRESPIFAGIWAGKDPGGVGGLFYDLTWDGLVTRWKELGASNQYLADVEAYEVNGQRRYAALWRIGPGNGALYSTAWPEFDKFWREARGAQDLIDLEVIETGGDPQFLGVWRRKQEKHADGALWVDMTWEQLLAKHKELGDTRYLADVETYMRGDQRKYAGVWRAGGGNGAFYVMNDWAKFAAKKQELNDTQQMIDFEMYQSTLGTWHFLGVWRRSESAGPLHASTSATKFNPLTVGQLVGHWKSLREKATLVGLTVVTPDIPPVTSLRGAMNCRSGDPDCNPCATDVPAQFKLAFEDDKHRPWIAWHDSAWTYTGDRAYPPDRVKPEEAFRHIGEDGLILSKHIQGFVRTNSSRFPYAGSHSHRSTGSIFFIELERGGYRLHSMYRSANGHPSGVAVLGDGLFVAEGPSLRRFSVKEAGAPQGYPRYDIPRKDGGRGLDSGGGGIGLAKLYDGSTLLVVSAPGNGFRSAVAGPAGKDAREDNARPRYTRFYRFVPNVFARDAEVSLLGEWPHEPTSANPSRPEPYSENLSLVTECGSGRLYTIHTTGHHGLKGEGYWTLSRVDGEPTSPRLTRLGRATQKQESESCHHRSTATVRVNASGQLEFLCSERLTTKKNPTGTFDFKEGRR